MTGAESNSISSKPKKKRRRRWTRRKRRIVTWTAVAVVLVLGLLIPNSQIIPVRDATTADWNHDTFWFHPWGRSGVHKGIDIFAAEGTDVVASTGGIVLGSGNGSMAGEYLTVLGPKWRVHYYAHLSRRDVSPGMFVRQGDVIGAVGSTGNAQGKPPHLHYAIVSAIPYPWKMTLEPQGWKRMVFLSPHEALTS